MLVFYFVLVFISHICSRVFLSLQNRELQIMRKLDHCNIVRLRYFFYSSGEKVQLVICFRPLVFVFLHLVLQKNQKWSNKLLCHLFHTLLILYSKLKKGKRSISWNDKYRSISGFKLQKFITGNKILKKQRFVNLYSRQFVCASVKAEQYAKTVIISEEIAI